VIPFLIAAITVLLLVPVARKVAVRAGFIDHPRADRFHAEPVPLLGGPACVGGIAAGIAAGAILHHGVWPAGSMPAAAAIGTVAFLGLGLIDDRRPIAPLPKAIAEGLILAMALLVWRPHGLLAGPAGIVAAWVGAMALVNAWNYLDHADGIFATASACAAAILSLSWTLDAADPRAAAALAGICGAMLAYLVFNRPPARIFLGDAGSLPIGFLITLACAALVDGARPAFRPAVAAALAIPLADMLLVTIVRLRARRSPFRGGREHTGHRLSARFGPRRAVVIVALASALSGALGLLLGPAHPRLAFASIGAFTLIFLVMLGLTPLGTRVRLAPHK